VPAAAVEWQAAARDVLFGNGNGNGNGEPPESGRGLSGNGNGNGNGEPPGSGRESDSAFGYAVTSAGGATNPYPPNPDPLWRWGTDT
jgi:hypothetical protein